MPFDYEIDESAGLVTVHARDGLTPAEALHAARRLVKEPGIRSSFALLVIVGQDVRDTTPEELGELAGILKLLDCRIRGRKAIVAVNAGRVTTARIVALFASTHDDVEAFTTEDAARAWLSAVPSA